MTEFGNNPQVNSSFLAKLFGKLRIFNNPNQNLNQKQQADQLQKPQTNQLNAGQTLANTGSNIPLNQTTLTNPALNQTALNLSNAPMKETINKQQASQNTSNAAYGTSSDLPSYAGIPNMSLKSWISEHSNRGYADLTSGEQQLAVTLEGIQGFQRKNYDGSDDTSGRRHQKSIRDKYFSILSHVFAFIEQSGSREIELLSLLANFKKLTSSSKGHEGNYSEEYSDETKLIPPLPSELPKLDLDITQIKYLQQLLGLPAEFPECLRPFAMDKNEINSNNLSLFLEQRFKIVQEQILGTDSLLNDSLAKFVPLLNTRDFTLILPLVLLYYPLPLPNIKPEYDFSVNWKKKKSKDENKDLTVASCEIYYLSKTRGTFLLKFELNKNDELSFDIQTSEENKDIVDLLESAICESMFLLEHSPLLSDLNVLLTKEIYNATDADEELSIVSSGPIKLEIILAVYASLVVLNLKL